MDGGVSGPARGHMLEVAAGRRRVVWQGRGAREGGWRDRHGDGGRGGDGGSGAGGPRAVATRAVAARER